jgi:hypothetical protein
MLAALETHPCVDESLLRIPFWSSHIALERKSAAVFNWCVGDPGYGGHVAIRIDGQFGYLHDGLSLCRVG